MRCERIPGTSRGYDPTCSFPRDAPSWGQAVRGRREGRRLVEGGKEGGGGEGGEGEEGGGEGEEGGEGGEGEGEGGGEGGEGGEGEEGRGRTTVGTSGPYVAIARVE
eukprot:766665-Hanusia_phi.AAC.2